ncbi:MAG: hypothetical protein BGP06_08995 [Rhizobiales bacterium 65-9]|nr:MAG: hypothetical protein BGP06_08995 [Rhizobiales bacterium 65-9]
MALQTQRPTRVGALLVLIAATLWAGMLIGVSFIATPVKFLAPSLTLPVALDVGRQTFLLFSRIEIGCAAALLLFTLLGARRFAAIAIAALLAAAVGAEVAWLLPALDARVSAIIAGQSPPPSQLHLMYVMLEAAKLALLGASVALSVRALSRAAVRPEGW